MTRCRDFYVKYKKDPSFCKDRITRNIDAHIAYLDKHFPNWLEENLTVEFSTLNEESIKPMKSLSKTDPELHQQALELVCEGVEPREAIKKAKEANVKTIDIPKECVNDSIENIEKYLDAGSVDLILTDPPYPKEYLDLWRVLGEKAKIILREGGFLLAYSGQYYLPEVLNMLMENLEYVWTFALTLEGVQNRVMQRNIWNGWKPIIVFAKPPYIMPDWQTDVLESPSRKKDKHTWQQNIEPVKELIERFTLKNQLVVDPFLGSGTTMQASKELGRLFFGMDIDKEVFRRG
ncbi:MAG: DNA methyltransferase [Planctomycetota bacterium]|jgi:16S rRNA G966 N2-methylase RsmD